MLQSQAYESTLLQFFDWCNTTTNCSFHAQDSKTIFQNLTSAADLNPIPAPGCNATAGRFIDPLPCQNSINIKPSVLKVIKTSGTPIYLKVRRGTELSNSRDRNTTNLPPNSNRERAAAEHARLATSPNRHPHLPSRVGRTLLCTVSSNSRKRDSSLYTHLIKQNRSDLRKCSNSMSRLVSRRYLRDPQSANEHGQCHFSPRSGIITILHDRYTMYWFSSTPQ